MVRKRGERGGKNRKERKGERRGSSGMGRGRRKERNGEKKGKR